MKATWARAMAAKINTKGSQYGEITQQIREAVEEGKYEMFYYESIGADVRKKLTADGFTVGETDFSRNENTTRISW